LGHPCGIKITAASGQNEQYKSAASTLYFSMAWQAHGGKQKDRQRNPADIRKRSLLLQQPHTSREEKGKANHGA